MSEQKSHKRSFADMPPEEVRAAARAGQAAAAEKRRRATKISDALTYLLSCRTDDPGAAARLEELGLDPTIASELALAAVDRGRSTGETASLGLIADRTEGKTPDRVEISGADGKPIESIDLSQMSDEQLKKLINSRKNDG